MTVMPAGFCHQRDGLDVGDDAAFTEIAVVTRTLT
jgi:hypothetical protein